MFNNALPMNPKGINGSKGQRSAPGTFATGKGTTAKIKSLYLDLNCAYKVSTIAQDLGLTARQLNKRFSELVASGFLKKAGKQDGVQTFIRATSPLVNSYVL